MPTYRNITISLQSQFDARAIPEYPPSSATPTPSPRKNDPHSQISTHAPTSPRLAEVNIPTYPNSQLWINYDCPVPDDTTSEETKFFYFKLFVGSKCLISWGVGAEDRWRGRTSFGIFQGEVDFRGRHVVEKRAFIFPSEEEVERAPGSFEIKVFRSKGRIREGARYHEFEVEAGYPEPFKWTQAGRMKKNEPRRMFSYALLDPVDEAYATFRYNCRTVAQLEQIGFGIEDKNGDEVRHMPSASPAQRSPASMVGLSPPAPAVPKDDLSRARRLSFPPRLHLAPPMIQPEAASPTKKDSDHEDEIEILGQSEPGKDQKSFAKETGPYQELNTPAIEAPNRVNKCDSTEFDMAAIRKELDQTVEEIFKGQDAPEGQNEQHLKDHVVSPDLSFGKKYSLTPPDKQEKSLMHMDASNRIGSLRGLANRWKRRSDSRDEKGSFGGIQTRPTRPSL